MKTKYTQLYNDKFIFRHVFMQDMILIFYKKTDIIEIIFLLINDELINNEK